jgi:hypothetical protein
MKIPTGDFGNVIARGPRDIHIPKEAFMRPQADTTSAAAGILSGLQIAQNWLQKRQQQEQELSDAQAKTATFDYEIATKAVAEDIDTRLDDGSLSHVDALEEYQKRIEQIPKPDYQRLDEKQQAGYSLLQKRIEVNALAMVQKGIGRAITAERKTTVDAGIDALGKLAGTPGTPTELAVKELDAYDADGRGVYGKNWGKVKQDATDRMWFNDARQGSLLLRNDPAALQKFEDDLVADTGRYAGKLDQDKKTLLLNQVRNMRFQAESRIQHAQAKRDADGARVLDEMDKQNDTGVPPSLEVLQDWEARTRGTPYEADFKEKMQEGVEIQNFLRLPLEKQAAGVQALRAEVMTKGGSVKDVQRLQKFEKLVQANVKQAQENPLLYLQNRDGTPVAPLDFSKMLTPDGQKAMGAQLRERVTNIQAMRAQLGDTIQNNPLLPQEREQFVTMISQAPPEQLAQSLGMMRQAIGDDETYTAVMRQISPNAPTKAMAGIIAAQSKADHLDATETPDVVARRMLAGEKLLASKKGANGEGTGSRFPMPSDAEFNAAVTDAVGDAFAGTSEGAYGNALTAVRSYYAALAQENGDYTGKANPDLMAQAVTAVLGATADVNGNGRVFVPWGMSADRFEAAAAEAFRQAAMTYGLEDVKVQDGQTESSPARMLSAADAWKLFGLQLIGTADDGSTIYGVTQGRRPLLSADGDPVKIRVTP